MDTKLLEQARDALNALLPWAQNGRPALWLSKAGAVESYMAAINKHTAVLSALDAALAQPAPAVAQGEAVAWMCCGSLFHSYDAIPSQMLPPNGFPVPLYAAPAAPPAQSKDAEDARRYRWLRDRLAIEDAERLHADFWGTPDEAESVKTDAALDAALAAAPAQPTPDEREAFEARFIKPDAVTWNGSEYEVLEGWENSYRIDRFLGQWQAWQARALLSAPATKDLK